MRVRPRRLSVALVASILVAAGPAHAQGPEPGPHGWAPSLVEPGVLVEEESDEPPATLTPVEPPRGGARRVEAGATSRYKVNNGGWTSVRSYAGSYVIGNAKDNWTLDVVAKPGNAWYYGYVFGDHESCGWLLTSNIGRKAGTPWQSCPTDPGNFRMGIRGFSLGVNCTSCGAATAVYTTAAATSCRNLWPPIRTFGPEPRTCLNPVREVPAGSRIGWRYTTLDGGWVLIRDPAVPDEQSDWSFLPRSALPPELPVYATP